MLFITSLSLLLSIGINHYIQNWNTSVQATFTLELPHQSGVELPDVIQVIKQYSEIEKVEILDKTYVQKLMFQMGIAATEAPILIDVIVTKEQLSNFDADKLLGDVQKIIPNAAIIKPVLTSPEALSMAKVIEAISLGFGLIMIIAMCAIIAFLMYSEVQTHERTIQLFNLLGAPNYFISKIFQGYVLTILLKSFFLSLAFNLCLYYGTYVLFLGESIHFTQELSWVTWAYVVFGIPILMVAIIQVIVPVTVLSCLKKKYNNSLHA
jgi:cell division protein FtsX